MENLLETRYLLLRRGFALHMARAVSCSAHMKLVNKLSSSIEAHYQWMEQSLGKDKLGHLYELLDELIALEQP